MTHDELLAKINAAGAYALQADSYGWVALRAVVELHKPIFEEGGRWCNCCKVKLYPCPTIQAIEKALL